MLEKTIEKKVCDYAKKQGCLVYKFVSPAHRGVPDRMFITPKGRVFFIEFKAPGKKPTPLQRHELDKLTNVGVFASYANEYETGRGLVDMMMLVL
jgi:hypothetical protein